MIILLINYIKNKMKVFRFISVTKSRFVTIKSNAKQMRNPLENKKIKVEVHNTTLK